MKKQINFLWWVIFGIGVLYVAFGCTPPTQPGAQQSEAEKPIVRVIPDSEYCKTIASPFATSRAVGIRGKYWDNGATLKIKLIGGTAQQRAYFTNAVLESQKYVNLNVSYVTTGNADIRVSFVTGGGSWSYIGKDALSVGQSYATLNLGWLGSDNALHEWFHALGAAHEQASPNSDIQWNKPVVYAALGGPPNNWPPETVDFNVFRKMTQAEADATTFDPTSIMQYSVPTSWTYNYPNGIPGGKVLSAQDIAFWSAKYPKAAPPPPPPVNVTITTAQRDNLRRIQNLSRLYSDSVVIYSKKIFGI